MDNYVQEKIRIGDLINSMMEQGYKQSHLMSVICSTSLDKMRLTNRQWDDFNRGCRGVLSWVLSKEIFFLVNDKLLFRTVGSISRVHLGGQGILPNNWSVTCLLTNIFIARKHLENLNYTKSSCWLILFGWIRDGDLRWLALWQAINVQLVLIQG